MSTFEVLGYLNDQSLLQEPPHHVARSAIALVVVRIETRPEYGLLDEGGRYLGRFWMQTLPGHAILLIPLEPADDGEHRLLLLAERVLDLVHGHAFDEA